MSSSFSYERYDRRSARSRGTFTYWIPLVITVTAAAGGLAAWVWSARSDHESSGPSEDEDLSYGEENVDRRVGGGPGAAVGGGLMAGSAGPSGYGVPEGVMRREEHSEYRTTSESRDVSGQAQEETFFGRVQGAIRRTPSPQQMFDMAGKRVAAGVAAAGAVVGTALGAIREEDRDYEDHERWSEEAEVKKNVTATSAESASAVATHAKAFATSVRDGPPATAPRSTPGAGGKRKNVAVVVSAESVLGGLDEEEHGSYTTEEATLLSHLPAIDPATTNLLVLIYNPLGRPPSSEEAGDNTNKPSSLGSSYAALNTPAQTPGEELQTLDPQPYSPSVAAAAGRNNELYDILHRQASRLVAWPANVLAFSTPTGYVHMLKHLAPDVVYVVDSLAGPNGANIDAVRGWVGQVVVVVGGDNASGFAGLIDTEDEGDGAAREKRHQDRWWAHSDMVGLGKGVEVVDGVRLAEDWERRIMGRE